LWRIRALVMSFVSKGFPYKDQIEELLIVMVYCMYSQRVTLSTFSLIATYFSKMRYCLFDLRVALNPNQSTIIYCFSYVCMRLWYFVCVCVCVCVCVSFGEVLQLLSRIPLLPCLAVDSSTNQTLLSWISAQVYTDHTQTW